MFSPPPDAATALAGVAMGRASLTPGASAADVVSLGPACHYSLRSAAERKVRCSVGLCAVILRNQTQRPEGGFKQHIANSLREVTCWEAVPFAVLLSRGICPQRGAGQVLCL
jgi:hypothetical protein